MFRFIKTKNNFQRGAILVFALLVMSMIMSITFAVLGILLPKIKIASDPLKSVSAVYAADSGLEWCLYKNRDKPDPPPIQSTLSTGATFTIYFGSNPATCASTEIPLNHRVVGNYSGVARSFEIY